MHGHKLVFIITISRLANFFNFKNRTCENKVTPLHGWLFENFVIFNLRFSFITIILANFGHQDKNTRCTTKLSKTTVSENQHPDWKSSF